MNDSPMKSYDGLSREGLLLHLDAYLIGSILSTLRIAKDKNSIAAIHIDDKHIMVVNLVDQCIITNMATGRLLKSFDVKPSSVEYYRRAEAKRLFQDVAPEPIEPILWQLARVTCQSTNVVGTIESENRFRLRRWPNVTYLNTSINEMRILAFWLQNPARPKEIAAALQIPLSEVLTVYVCAQVCDLISLHQSDDETRSGAVSVAKDYRSFLSSVLRRLFRRWVGD